MRIKRLAPVIILVALFAGLALYSFIAVEDATIQLNVSKPDKGSSAYNADLTFAGMATFIIGGYCQRTNFSSQLCDIGVTVALSTNTSSVNSGLATKTITLMLLGSEFSQLAVLSYQNSNTLSVMYGKDNSGDESATVTTPALFGGSTWGFDFLISNAPTNSTGQAILNLVISAQLVHTGLVGHNYDLQASLLLPIHSCISPTCV
jgi:hypothetical protein